MFGGLTTADVGELGAVAKNSRSSDADSTEPELFHPLLSIMDSSDHLAVPRISPVRRDVSLGNRVEAAAVLATAPGVNGVSVTIAAVVAAASLPSKVYPSGFVRYAPTGSLRKLTTSGPRIGASTIAPATSGAFAVNEAAACRAC